jgi:hypothetical protein
MVIQKGHSGEGFGKELFIGTGMLNILQFL